MSYQALYRKFRPQDFNEVSGQNHIVTALKNQINSGRVGHAYVFSGTRGTGKTSIAKIFAKALNCEDLKEGNPCNACTSCKKINEGASFNVSEIDAASNRGIDDAKQIIEDVSYPPVEGKTKVYIIDEAHMLTREAFNALLKTIEEPPGYAIFILATTEATKIPITIMSRCQRYDFRRMGTETIVNRLVVLKSAENISIEDRALKYIARQADGSMRDALSIFDQCISFFYGETITYDMALEMLGTADTEIYSGLYRAINGHDHSRVISIVEEMVIRGMEPETFVADFVWYLRNLLMVKCGENIEDVTDISSDEVGQFMEEVSSADENYLIRCISVLSELSAQLRFSTVKRIALETGLIRLCRPQMDNDYDALIDRIRMLESNSTPRSLPEPVTSTKEKELSKSEQESKEIEVRDSTPPFGSLSNVWGSFLESMDPMERAMTMKAVVCDVDENTAEIYLEEGSVGASFYSKPERSDALIKRISAFMGREIIVSIKTENVKNIPRKSMQEVFVQQEEENFFENVQLAGIPIEIEKE